MLGSCGKMSCFVLEIERFLGSSRCCDRLDLGSLVSEKRVVRVYQGMQVLLCVLCLQSIDWEY